MERNVIDKMLVNAKMYSYFQDMESDEKQEAIDVTDHNLLRAEFLIADTMKNFNKHTKWGKIQYYKTDANLLDQLVAKVLLCLAQGANIIAKVPFINQTAIE